MSEGLSPGAILAHYRIVSRFGAGGMGEVFLAQDTVLDRPVALKILDFGLAKLTATRPRPGRGPHCIQTAAHRARRGNGNHRLQRLAATLE